MIKVLIVDDHALFAEGMKAMFKPEDGIELISHTTNGYEVVSLLEALPVNVILMDIDMPLIDGIATMELIRAKGITTPILMLTMHQSMKQIKKALEKGAQGYILKDANKPELVEAITTVSQMKNYFHPKINEQIFDYLRGKRTSKMNSSELSEREIEIIRCVAEGKNSKEISTQLCLSEFTVKTHRRNIMHKLHAKTSGELIHLASEKGII
ncbi:MAG: response regulator transcription factor [Cytophagales bacterium]|jgi:DNA-binding NarL/FixJ family response regulator|nr:response regulator transcription factor [Cytophagales bacterium]MCA6388144.1 response regulator transcription factor [Cytophagales bacterium]MCA6391913.1 response regulator transcription factor [Cytophagales bacterium]MCA6395371.1 response regulator transcription factor [Cytophagales bacterium]MCA6400017.1 response regulator transcription factor [Cytophagales bacterium]